MESWSVLPWLSGANFLSSQLSEEAETTHAPKAPMTSETPTAAHSGWFSSMSWWSDQETSQTSAVPQDGVDILTPRSSYDSDSSDSTVTSTVSYVSASSAAKSDEIMDGKESKKKLYLPNAYANFTDRESIIRALDTTKFMLTEQLAKANTKCAELTRQAARSESECTELKDEIADLKQQVSFFQSRLQETQHLQQQIQELETQLGQVKEGRDAEVGRLVAEVERLRSYSEEVLPKYHAEHYAQYYGQQLSDHEAEHKKEVECLKAQHATEIKSAAEGARKEGEAQGVAGKTKEVEELQKKLEEANAVKDRFKRRMEELEEDVRVFRDERVPGLEVRVKEKEKEVQIWETRFNGLGEKFAARGDALLGMQKRVEGLQADLAKEREECKERVRELEIWAVSAEETVQEMNVEMKEAVAEWQVDKDELVWHEAALRDAERNLGLLSVKCDELMGFRALVQQEQPDLAAATRQLQKAEAELGSCQARFSAQGEELASLRVESAGRQAALLGEVAAVRAAGEAKRERGASLAAELARCQHSLACSTTLCCKCAAGVAEGDRREHPMRGELEAALERVEAMIGEVERARREKEEIESAITDMRLQMSSLPSLVSDNAELRQQVDVAASEASRAEERLQACYKEQRRLERTNSSLRSLYEGFAKRGGCNEETLQELLECLRDMGELNSLSC